MLVAVDGDALIDVMQADLALAAPRGLPEVTMLYVEPSAWGSASRLGPGTR